VCWVLLFSWAWNDSSRWSPQQFLSITQ
jgi:hypothetical protein